MIPSNHPHRPLMFSKLRFTMLFPLAALLGCGVNPTPPSSSPATFDLSGDWLAMAPAGPGLPLTLPTPVAEFSGALQFNGNAVTGTFRALATNYPNPCVSILQDLQVTGTLDASNNLSLTIPISGGTATIAAPLQNAYTYFNNGTWQITGGACAMASTQITMAHIAPVTGTYSGTFNVLNLTTVTIEPGTATTITAVLAQSTTPNADGQFPLTGTITATGACSGTFPLVNEVVSGGSITLSPPLTGSSTEIFDGAVEPTGTYIVGAFLPLNACGSQDFSGTLTRQ